MKNLLILFVFSFLNYSPVCSQVNSIDEEAFVTIGGIEQYITIKGLDSSKPVILFLHGGPGSPLSPYSNSLFQDWEKNFVLVQWDQRGTGKTFGKYAPEELDPAFLEANPLTVEQMSSDGIELAEYLIEKLDKQKIILLGTSWGTVLGVKMAFERPDLFHAYIGHSQVVNPSEDFINIHRKMEQLVLEANDKESAEILEQLGSPPYDSARNTGQFIRLIKKYERKNSEPSPESWNEISSEYDTTADNRNRAEGDDYSFLHYVGDKKFGIKPMISGINLAKEYYNFRIPVYLVQGKEDILTPTASTKAYFDKIVAPDKDYFVVTNAAHGFNSAVINTLLAVLKEEVLPKI